MPVATQEQFQSIINELKTKDSVKIVCVYNEDNDGDVQNDFVIGRTYLAKYPSGSDRFDVYSENGCNEIWEEFNGGVYDRYKFFKLAQVTAADLAEERQLKAKKTALEKKSTDDLIKLIKSSQLDLELSKGILRERIEGLI